MLIPNILLTLGTHFKSYVFKIIIIILLLFFKVCGKKLLVITRMVLTV